MSSRTTQTVANHLPGRRDVRWGWDAKSTVVAIIGLSVTILVGGIAAWTSLNREVAEIRATQAAALNDLPDKIAAAIAAAAKTDGNVSRDEWTTYKQAKETAEAARDKRLDRIENNGFRQLRALEDHGFRPLPPGQ